MANDLTTISEQKLEKVFIFGNDPDENFTYGAFRALEAIISPIFSQPGNLKIGTREQGATLEDIRKNLEGRIDENTRIFILAHGGKKDGEHIVTLNAPPKNTRNF